MAGGANPAQTQAPNVYQQSAGSLNQATQMATQAGTPGNLNSYMNPYTSQVINNSMGDLDRARQMTQNQNGAAASAAGAFGGSRHGLVEAETNRAFADTAGNMASGLRMQGFQNAQSQDLANRQQQISAAGQLGQLSNLGFGMGNQINANLSQQGAQQQAAMQALIDAGKGQFQGFTGAPQQALQPLLAALGASPQPTSTTNTKNPGFFDYLSLGAGTAANIWGG